MGLVDYAKSELAQVLQNEKDKNRQEAMNQNILEIVEKFSEQGHSGFSAGYILTVLDRLLRYKPLSPLTGADDEWNKVSPSVYQNKRCPSVFKESDGVSRDIGAIVVSDDGGITWFYTKEFDKQITFPYTVPNDPERIYIERIGEEYEIITDKPERIEALRDREQKIEKEMKIND